MYIKPSAPVLRSDSGTKSLKINKKTDSGSEVFRDILEDIDVVELSSGLDPDEDRKQGAKNQSKDKNENIENAVLPINTTTSSKSVNRFV